MGARRRSQTEAEHRLKGLGWELLSVYVTNVDTVKARHLCGKIRVARFCDIKAKCICNYVSREESVRKQEITCLKRYGVRNPMKLASVQAKVQASTKARLGVSFALQSDKSKRKLKRTLEERYGSEVHNVMDVPEFRTSAGTWMEDPRKLQKRDVKRATTCIEKYGVEYVFQSSEFKRKSKRTYTRNYGVSNPMQVREIHERAQKTGYRTKTYTTKQGRELQLQGYEPIVASELESLGHRVRTSKFSIPYVFDETPRVYFPDLDCKTLGGKGVILEVKSEYTLKAELAKNLAKFQAANEFARTRGFIFTLVVFTDDGGRVIKFPTEQKISYITKIT